MTLKIGQWVPATDAFTAHPASPTAAVFDMNDGAIFSILDPSNEGTGVDFGNVPPDVLKSGNPRTTGERVTRINWGKNRQVKALLTLGQTADYPTFSTQLHNLQQLCAGITPDLPAALQIKLAPTSSVTFYADVLQASVVTAYKEVLWIQDIDDGIEVIFECKPFFRSNRQWLQNLVWNPGFEAPSGPGVSVFNDPFANTNAYSIQVGGPLGTDTTRVPDIIQGFSPRTYLTLNETSGTTAFDVMANVNGTIAASVTLGSTALRTGDSVTSMLFNGTSGNVLCANTGTVPAANAPLWLVAAIRVASLPAGTQVIAQLGAFGAGVCLEFLLDATGKPQCGNANVSAQWGSAISTAATHLLVGVFDGTKLYISVDGGALTAGVTGGVTLGSVAFAVGSTNSSSIWFAGNVEDAAWGTGTLTQGQINTLWTTYSTSPATNSASITMPANCQIKFGSPAWQAVNQWRVRFRYASSGSFSCYLHFTDSNNNLLCQYNTSANGTLGLFHKVVGVLNTVSTVTAVHLTPGAKYWMSITQFPSVTNNPPQVQIVLAPDAGGAPAVTAIATVGPITISSASVAISGQPQILAGGATIGVDKNTVSMFGPGGMYFIGTSGTSATSAAWEGSRYDIGMSGNNGNSYTGGVTASYGAGRIDGTPTGAWTASWRSGDVTSTTTVTATALPVKTAGDVLGVSVYAMNNTSSVTAAMSINFTEYDSSGNLLRTGANVASLSGAQASYTQMSGIYTTGANCAYVILICAASDSTANSAGKQFWFDNLCVWDQTQTGMTSMPYCELRFPQSPAQLAVTGILGDVATYAYMAAATLSANFTSNSSLTFYVGRRGQSSKNAVLYGPGFLQTTGTGSTNNFYALDSTAYNGFLCTQNATNASRPARILGFLHPSDVQGQYHVLNRFYIGTAQGNFTATPTQYAGLLQRTSQWYGDPTTTTTYQSDLLAEWDTATVNVSTYQTWFVQDVGLVTLPGGAVNALSDSSQTYLELLLSFNGSISASDLGSKQGWIALVPVDGNILIWTLTNPNTFFPTLSTKWMWTYSDGLTYGVQGTPAWNYSAETAAIMNPGKAGAGLAASTNYPYLQSTADPCVTLDPAQANDTNQFVAIAYDSSVTVLPFVADIVYSPRYLQPN